MSEINLKILVSWLRTLLFVSVTFTTVLLSSKFGHIITVIRQTDNKDYCLNLQERYDRFNSPENNLVLILEMLCTRRGSGSNNKTEVGWPKHSSSCTSFTENHQALSLLKSARVSAVFSRTWILPKDLSVVKAVNPASLLLVPHHSLLFRRF